MKTIFDNNTRAEILARVNSLSDKSTAKWGKMNVYQMMKHCTLWEKMIHGDVKYKRLFIGRIIGRLALKTFLKDERPFQKNTPTFIGFKISETGEVEIQKKEWIEQIERYQNFSNANVDHIFFGRLTQEQTGQLVYKHIDHHLRQFKV